MSVTPGALVDQATSGDAAPITVDANAFVFAVPAAIVQEVGETVTTGGAVMNTEALAVTFMSSKEVAETVTVAEGDGVVFGE